MTVVAKSSQPANPTPTLFVTAFNGTTTLIAQTAMTRVTTAIGAIACTTVDPCWQLPLRRTAADVKPTSVVVQSSKLGTATALAGTFPF